MRLQSIKQTLFLLLATIVFSQSSCRLNELKGEGKKSTLTPAVGSFNSVDIDMSIKTEINMQTGAAPSVQINGYENVAKHLKAVIENNKLTIRTDLDETWSIDTDDITIVITMPSIVALSLSGASDAEIQGNLTGKEFKVDISGAGDIKIDNLNVEDFSLEISGAGDVEIKAGSVKHASYEINGAGDLKAYPLQSTETTATISGAGSAQVTASEKLTASINGAGSIKYKGHPSVTQDVSGVGSVSDAN